MDGQKLLTLAKKTQELVDTLYELEEKYKWSHVDEKNKIGKGAACDLLSLAVDLLEDRASYIRIYKEYPVDKEKSMAEEVLRDWGWPIKHDDSYGDE